MALQAADDFLLCLAGELRHERNVHPRTFAQGNGEGFCRGVYVGDFLVGIDGALGEHIRFSYKFALIVQDFQSA